MEEYICKLSSNMGLIAKICKELEKLDPPQKNPNFKKWAKEQTTLKTRHINGQQSHGKKKKKKESFHTKKRKSKPQGDIISPQKIKQQQMPVRMQRKEPLTHCSWEYK